MSTKPKTSLSRPCREGGVHSELWFFASFPRKSRSRRVKRIWRMKNVALMQLRMPFWSWPFCQSSINCNLQALSLNRSIGKMKTFSFILQVFFSRCSFGFWQTGDLQLCLMVKVSWDRFISQHVIACCPIL